MITPTGAEKSRTIGNRLFTLICIMFSLFQIYTGLTGALPHMMQRSIHVMYALILLIGFSYLTRKKQGTGIILIDIGLSIGILLSTLYVATNYSDLLVRRWMPEPIEYVFFIIIVVAVFEACRRTMGWVLLFMAAVIVVYTFLGPYFPGMWKHPGFNLEFLVSRMYMSDMGLWGPITGVSATIIAIFIIFGSVMANTGGGKSFIDISLILTGKQVGGAAKVATIASSLFGTISGSGMGNAAASGAVTIPMMKKLGYRPAFAAGVEAVASTGGQLMPPIMGAGAFVMADITGISYLKIIIAAIIPAILFYIGIFFSIHFYSLRTQMSVIPDDQIKKWKSVLNFSTLVNLIIPIGILIFFLVSGYSLGWAGAWGTITAIVTYLLFSRGASLKQRCRDILKSLADAGATLSKLGILVVVAQIIVSLITVTGVGIKFTSLLLSIGGENLFLLLFIGMFAAILLGMGLPTVAAYIFAASILVPAVIKLGVPILPAHFFVFYFAIIASITPPICTAVYAASGIAQTSWTATSKHALALGFSAFVIPFLFAYNEALLSQGPIWMILRSALLAAVVVAALSSAVMGFAFSKLLLRQRLLMLAGALCVALASVYVNILGFILVGFVAFMSYRRKSTGDAPNLSLKTDVPV